MTDITAWKQQGQICLWHYTENERNYPGWHLSANAIGSTSLVGLLRAFGASKVEAQRTLALVSPSKAVLGVPNNRGGAAAFRAPSKWRLKYMSDSCKARTWRFEETDNIVELTLGSDGLEELTKGASDSGSGKGDYSIGLAGNEQLWFWWWPK